MDSSAVYVYGSLVGLGDGRVESQPDLTSLRPAVLEGYRRTWNVAMDNSRRIPGYKQYVDPATGEPPGCFVVFLNVVVDGGARVNGALVEVSADGLAALDRRERNYERIDISAQLAEPVDGTAWAYVGSSEAVERFRIGQRGDRAVISEAYRDAVRDGFLSLGVEAAAQFDALTEAPPCPVVPLRRVPILEHEP
jgi:hypothetical protein